MARAVRARQPRDADEQKKILQLSRPRHAPVDWIERATIIALSWDGLAVPEVAGKLGCSPEKVRRWLHRFNASGIAGRGNRPGAGRKRRITEGERSVLIAPASSDSPGRPVREEASGELAPPIPTWPEQWTLDTLTAAARELGIDIHRSQVRRILRAEGVRWRRPRSWASSRDPQFAPKGRRSWSSTRPRPRAPR
ncbi:helix-turn-helix domain-containing protein [Streptomyces sp. NPDC002814]